MNGIDVKNPFYLSDLRYIKGQTFEAEKDRVMMEWSRRKVKTFEFGSQGVDISRDGGREQTIKLKELYEGKD